MKNTKNKKTLIGYNTINMKFITYVLFFYVIWKTSPIVSYYMNTYVAMLLIVGMLFLLLLDNKNYPIKSLFIVSVVYLILDFFGYITLGNPIVLVMWSVFLDIMPLIVGCYMARTKMNNFINFITPSIIIVYFITAVTTFIGLVSFPNASRIMAADSEAYKQYFRMNIGGFDFIYSLVLAHPMIVCALKSRKKSILSIAFSVVSGMCIFKSAYTTAALMFIISLIVYLFPDNKSIRVSRARIRIIVLVLMSMVLVLPYILNLIAGFDVLEESAEKIRGIADMLHGNGTNELDLLNRQDVYNKSWDAFKSNILFGTKLSHSYSAGGHSFVLDTMAGWGIIGLTIIIMLYYSIGMFYKRISSGTTVYYYAVLTLILAIVLSVINPTLWTYELGFIIPVCILYSVRGI